MERIFHIASLQDWLAAQRTGHYEGDTLATEGFVHCSFANQLADVANASFAGRGDLVVLGIDPDRVVAQLRIEDGFPHVYGPIRVEAVVDVQELSPDPDGSFSF